MKEKKLEFKELLQEKGIELPEILVAIDHPDESLSDETTEMLSRTPDWFMQWGVLSIFSILLLLALIASMIKYPDTLEGKAVLTTSPLPLKIKAQTSGRLVQLLVKDNQLIKVGQVIAEIENDIGLKQINLLERTCKTIFDVLKAKEVNLINKIALQDLDQLGEAQEIYNRLLQNINTYSLIQRQQIYNKRIANLKHQRERYSTLNAVKTQERKLITDELKKAEELFLAKKTLFEKKIISKKEYLEDAGGFSQKKRELESQRSSKIQNDIAIDESSKQLLETEFEQTDKENSLLLTIADQVRNLRTFIQNWKLKYLLTAPFNGRIFEVRSVQLNEVVNSGDELFLITPQEFQYIGYVYVPSINFGKIDTAQNVHLLLDQFPYNEFGYLEGKVGQIGSAPQSIVANTQNKNEVTLYRVSIKLPNGLNTSYHQLVPFTPEMNGIARIITKDKNLWQRFFDSIATIDK